MPCTQYLRAKGTAAAVGGPAGLAYPFSPHHNDGRLLLPLLCAQIATDAAAVLVYCSTW